MDTVRSVEAESDLELEGSSAAHQISRDQYADFKKRPGKIGDLEEGHKSNDEER